MINAGRVAIVPKGVWEASVNYGKLDFITYEGNAYIGIVDNIPVGTLPTDTNYFLKCFTLDDYLLTSDAQKYYATIYAPYFEYSISLGRKAGTSNGNASFACGQDVTASEIASHAEGYETVSTGTGSHTEGMYTKADGPASHAEGFRTKSADYSHAEGHGTQALGLYSHAEGKSTISNGDYSHAEGCSTQANGDYSYAGGYLTKANTDYSQANGWGTIANCRAQTVIGQFNIEDTNNRYALIVGNGEDSSKRSDALTINWNGEINDVRTRTLSGEIEASLSSANNTIATFSGYGEVLSIGGVKYITKPSVSGATCVTYYDSMKDTECYVEVFTNMGGKDADWFLIVLHGNTDVTKNAVYAECEIKYRASKNRSLDFD